MRHRVHGVGQAVFVGGDDGHRVTPLLNDLGGLSRGDAQLRARERAKQFAQRLKGQDAIAPAYATGDVEGDVMPVSRVSIQGIDKYVGVQREPHGLSIVEFIAIKPTAAEPKSLLQGG